jgi:DNA-binding FrmR family transcriptional regulator
MRSRDGAPCAALQMQIQAIDAAARQPQSAPMQDHLRAKRAAARSRQITLSC